MARQIEPGGDPEVRCQSLQLRAVTAFAHDHQPRGGIAEPSKGAQQQREVLLAREPPDRDVARRSRDRTGARKSRQLGELRRLERGVLDDRNAQIRHLHRARDLFAHRRGHADEAVEPAALNAQPEPIAPPRRSGQVAPLQIVADLDHDRRAIPAKQQLQRDRDDCISVARREQHIDLVAAQPAPRRPDHPQGLEAGGRHRFGALDIVELGRGIAHRACAAAEQNFDLRPVRLPRRREV